MPADLTTVLGRLLADPALRAEFRRDPAATARRLDADLSAIDPDELERQAETLVDKRFHEVAKLLPRTIALQGGDAARIFAAHASLFWPEGHRRHADDAVAFVRFLRERDFPWVRAEYTRLVFAMRGSRLSFRLVPDAWVGGRARRALQILYRRRGAVRSLALYFGF
jgi:hypothetical protein